MPPRWLLKKIILWIQRKKFRNARSRPGRVVRSSHAAEKCRACHSERSEESLFDRSTAQNHGGILRFAQNDNFLTFPEPVQLVPLQTEAPQSEMTQISVNCLCLRSWP